MDNELVNQTPQKEQVQMEYQDWEMGIFFHFGIRTFYEGHQDGDGIPMPPKAFNPKKLNCDQWIETAKQAGMQYAVLVCKHGDGFLNWQSKTSGYGVAQTPWQNGNGDVVLEFTDACRRHGMKVGLYYSPEYWTNDPDFRVIYDKNIICEQLGELLNNYGQIDMLWFDGGKLYDEITDDIRDFGIQTNTYVLIFNVGKDPDYRWVRNEWGMASLPNWNTSGNKWLPAECDCMMRWNSWFFQEADKNTVKPLQELMSMYYLSVGRGANLLLNIGPDRDGLLPDADCKRLLEFGAEIERRFGNPLLTVSDVTLYSNSEEYCMEWEYELGEPFYLDHVILQEDLTKGETVSETVKRFKIIIKTHHDDVTIYEGQNIGHKAICSFPLVACLGVKVQITEPYPSVDHLRSVSLYNTTGLTHQH
jgi:alpha-L-fucosidase